MQMEVLLLFLFLSWRSPSHRRCRRGRGNHKVLAIKEIKRLTPRDREGGREGGRGGMEGHRPWLHRGSRERRKKGSHGVNGIKKSTVGKGSRLSLMFF